MDTKVSSLCNCLVPDVVRFRVRDVRGQFFFPFVMCLPYFVGGMARLARLLSIMDSSALANIVTLTVSSLKAKLTVQVSLLNGAIVC